MYRFALAAAMLLLAQTGVHADDNVIWSRHTSSGTVEYGSYSSATQIFVKCSQYGQPRAVKVRPSDVTEIDGAGCPNGDAPPHITGVPALSQELFDASAPHVQNAITRVLKSPSGATFTNAVLSKDPKKIETAKKMVERAMNPGTSNPS
jgi:hypothetical protein